MVPLPFWNCFSRPRTPSRAPSLSLNTRYLNYSFRLFLCGLETVVSYFTWKVWVKGDSKKLWVHYISASYLMGLWQHLAVNGYKWVFNAPVGNTWPFRQLHNMLSNNLHWAIIWKGGLPWLIATCDLWISLNTIYKEIGYY